MTPRNPSNNNGHVRRDKEPMKRITDRMAGGLCILYLLLMLAFLAWQLFDTWIGQYSLIKHLGYGLQREQTLRLIAFTLIAGALGGVVNGLRSTLHYRDRFERQHVWKYLCAPWMGATLALFVFALLRSGISVLAGTVAENVGNTQVLSNFSAGALVGYGAKDVFNWLDAKVKDLFQVTPSGGTDRGKEPPPSQPKNGKRVGRVKVLMNREKSNPVTVASNGRAH